MTIGLTGVIIEYMSAFSVEISDKVAVFLNRKGVAAEDDYVLVRFDPRVIIAQAKLAYQAVADRVGGYPGALTADPGTADGLSAVIHRPDDYNLEMAQGILGALEEKFVPVKGRIKVRD